MELSISEKAKLIDVIILLNSRFTKLYSKALSIQRKDYLKRPIVKINLDDDKDHNNFITMQLNLGIAENNSEAKLNDFNLNLILPDDQLTGMLKNDTQYKIAETLQNEIIIQLLHFCELDRFADNITNANVYNNAELDTIGTINFLIQKIIDSHYFNANAVRYVLGAIKNLNDGLLPYLNAVQVSNKLFSYFDSQPVTFKLTIENNQGTNSDHELIKRQLKNRKTLAKSINSNHKSLTKLAIEAYLFTIYIQHIGQAATILNANANNLSQGTQKTFETLADFIYYATPQQIKKHFAF